MTQSAETLSSHTLATAAVLTDTAFLLQKNGFYVRACLLWLVATNLNGLCRKGLALHFGRCSVLAMAGSDEQSTEMAKRW